MSRINSVAGQDLREMFSAATSWLEKSSADIDALHVFPVPDGRLTGLRTTAPPV